MWSRCVLTVASEMNSRAAAPRFVSPWAISARTSSSRSLRASCAGARSWLTSRVATDERENRLAASRRPDRADELVARRVLQQVARRAGLEGRDDVAVGVVGRQDEDPGPRPRSARARIAATPPMPGIRRSIRMTSGRRVPGEGDRLRAIGGLADHLELRVAGEHPAEAVADDRMVVDDQHPDRGHGAIGAVTTARRAGRDRRDAGRDRRAAAGLRFDRERAGHASDPLAHPGQAEPGPVGLRRARRR